MFVHTPRTTVTPRSHNLSSSLPKLTVLSVAPMHDTIGSQQQIGSWDPDVMNNESPFFDRDSVILVCWQHWTCSSSLCSEIES